MNRVLTLLKDKPALFWVDAALKLALYCLLVFAVLRQDLEQFQGKAIEARALFYPLATLLPYIAWRLHLRRHGSAPPFPYTLDILFTLPFLVDTAGNALNLYDSIVWWDDFNHFLNWFFVVMAFGQLLLVAASNKQQAASDGSPNSKPRTSNLVIWGLMVGFGAVTALLWEFGEYYTFIKDSDELATAYTDTLGDLALGLIGSVLAATLTAFWLNERSSPSPRPSP